MAKASYKDIFTEDVVRRWYREWLSQGKSAEWIAENNGLQHTSGHTIRKYLKKFGYPTTLEEAGEPKRAEPGPEIDPEEGDPAKTYDLQPHANGTMPVSGSLPAVIDQLQALRTALGAAGAEVSVQAQIDLRIRMRIGEGQ